MIQGPQAPQAPPVPPASYWPDGGGERPVTSKAPGWAKGLLAGAAAVAVLGGALIAVRNVGQATPVALPTPTFDLPSALPSGTGLPPSDQPTSLPSQSESESASSEPTASASASSTFAPLKAIPEVCDLLPASLTTRLAPKSQSEPGVEKDGFGALRKGCEWNQNDKNLKNGVLQWRGIHLSVNVWPTVDDAREDADSQFDSMGDLAGTKEENPGLKYLSTYGQIKNLDGIGDEARALYTENLKGTTNAWAFVVMGNTTITVRYFGTDNQNGELNAEGKDTKPVAEDVLIKGAEEVAKQAVKGLTG
jgi:alkylated DNA nucleotide flippase Atl1